MVLLPLGEIVARSLLGTGIPGSGPFVQHLTLWVGFLGAALAARDGKLLSLATRSFLKEGSAWRRTAQIFSSAVAAGISVMLCRASIDLVLFEREGGLIIAAGIPRWVGQLVLPIAFALIAARLVWRAEDRWVGRAWAGAGAVVGALLGQFPQLLEARPAWPGVMVILLAALLGAPIFAVLGGAAVLLFLSEGITAAAVPAATYELVVNPTLPAIPLFTLAGFFLAEGGAAQRLLRVFRALVGWIPGGTAVVCAAVCAFFTAFTGGSGVTILALGGILFQGLRSDGYRERFSLGFLTASGSLGLLFPPALPLILYGIVAQHPIDDFFIAGILPGILLVVIMAAWGVREGRITGAGRARFSWAELGSATWSGKWELLLPVLILTAIFSGLATPVEAAALAAFYAFVVQCLVVRDVSFRGGLMKVLRQCAALIGGVLIILGVAKGLTSYWVDVQFPAQLVGWVEAHIHHPLVFLLCLNIFLLLVGCFMDIFSAIVVVVPLIVPLGVLFGIHPVHLGIIFIANLELGYLTPPVGLNLFLASYRFDRPLLSVYRAAIPMLVILGVGVLVITYFPPLTLVLLRLMGRG